MESRADIAAKDNINASINSAPTHESVPGIERDNWFIALEKLALSRIVLLICLLAFLAYANSLGGEFVFDDTEQIVENPAIRSWDNLAKAFTTSVWAFREETSNPDAPPSLPYYRPLFTVFLTFGYQLFVLWPQGWHLMSLLLHILCSVGVYFVINSLAQRKTIAIFSSILFAVYPVHSESVCWISGITDPLYGVFFLASFFFYLKFCEARHQRTGVEAAQDKSTGLLVASLALFILAAYSKETALSLVVLIFGYEFINSSGNLITRLRSAALPALPYFAAAFLYLIPRYLVLGENMWSNSQIAARPLAHTLLTLPFILCSYIFHLVWPFGLSVTYNTHFVTSISSAKFIFPTAFLLLLAAICFALRKRISKDAWVAMLIIFVPLLPVLKIGGAVLEEYLVSDRYLYISVAGLAWLASIVLSGFVELKRENDSDNQITFIHSTVKPKFVINLMIVCVILLTLMTARENLAWANSYSLWSNVAKVRPEYWAPHYNRGLALLDMNKPTDALVALERAASLKADEPNVFDALGRAYAAIGNKEKAINNFNRALELEPRMVESLNNLGTVYFDAGDYAMAERYFKESLIVRPQAAVAHFNLAQCYSRQNRSMDAVEQFEEYLKAAPADAQARYELGLVYEKIGRKEDAIRQFRMGLESTRSKELVGVLSKSLDRIRGER